MGIKNDLEEAVAADHQSGQVYEAIAKQPGVHHSTVRKIIHYRKAIKTISNLPRGRFTPRSDHAKFREFAKKIKILFTSHFAHK